MAMAGLEVRVRAAGDEAAVVAERKCQLTPGDLEQSPGSIYHRIQELCSGMLPAASSLKITYLDDDGDAATLVECTVPDALEFARPVAEGGVRALQLRVSDGGPAGAPSPKPGATAPTKGPATAVCIEEGLYTGRAGGESGNVATSPIKVARTFRRSAPSHTLKGHSSLSTPGLKGALPLNSSIIGSLQADTQSMPAPRQPQESPEERTPAEEQRPLASSCNAEPSVRPTRTFRRSAPASSPQLRRPQQLPEEPMAAESGSGAPQPQADPEEPAPAEGGGSSAESPAQSYTVARTFRRVRQPGGPPDGADAGGAAESRAAEDGESRLQSLQRDVESKAATIRHLQTALDAKSMTIRILSKAARGGVLEQCREEACRMEEELRRCHAEAEESKAALAEVQATLAAKEAEAPRLQEVLEALSTARAELPCLRAAVAAAEELAQLNDKQWQAESSSMRETLAAAEERAQLAEQDWQAEKSRLQTALAAAEEHAQLTAKQWQDEVPPLREAYLEAQHLAERLEGQRKAEAAAAKAEAASAKEQLREQARRLAAAEEALSRYGAAPASPAPVARAVRSGPLVLGVEAQEDMTARGDATKEFKDALQAARAQQAFRIGRIRVRTDETGEMPACANITLRNDGRTPWPATAAISLVSGPALGLPVLPLEAAVPGGDVEVEMDLLVPPQKEAGFARSVWSIVDAASGAPFGQLLVFEVVFVANDDVMEGA